MKISDKIDNEMLILTA